jgi:outer membrane cobalamin receptor
LQINNQLQLTHNFNASWNLNATLHYTYGNGYYDQYKNARTLEEYKLTTLVDKEGNLLEESNLIRQKHMFNHFGGLVTSANYKNNSVDLSIGAAWSTYGGDHFGKVIEVADAVNFTAPTEYYRNSSLKHDGNIYAKINWDIFPTYTGELEINPVREDENGNRIYTSGGSWSSAATACYSYNFPANIPGNCSDSTGFRVVRSAK